MKGYNKLTEGQKQLFEETHQAHLSIMDSEMRKKHTREQVAEVKWDNEEKCLKVYFSHGECYHYLPTQEWS